MKCKRTKRLFAILAWLLGLTLCLTAPVPGRAEEEGTPCSREPTDMYIWYGDLIICSIETIGDSDLYRFDGNPEVVIAVQASRQNGPGTPCIELFDPDGLPVSSKVCSIFGAEIQATLDKTGVHTILASEDLNDGTVQYALGLQCIGDCVPVPIPDVCGWAKHKGAPLPDRPVLLKQRGEDRQKTRTDANGYYEFESIAPGKKYKVIIKGIRHQ